ncbi:MAG TPA: DUF1801 domain-containing protein [Thermoflexales bacterium]|nr:DUF1801 domain-containing protein [Thermoflexales bacterium]HQW36735.1 DUF1801 domain-containing protein [Thermoflexales bacterium]HQZ21596.1 DUF1801 domain-containing protein [Thermoflexales bacterium]HRA00527.1 DUF1801 domain-containing protein [Thermoflexales bacterium]
MISPDQFFAHCSPQTRAIASRLRALVMETVPASVERVYAGWGVLGLLVPDGKRERYFAYINPHPAHATIGFHYGAALNDPRGLLEDENLKWVRFISVRDANDPRLPHIAELIAQAAQVALLPKLLREELRAQKRYNF